MANSKIFCNTPWYELHIYWDGSLGICCQEDHKLYSGGDYNIARMSIREWFNSEPVQKFRKQIKRSYPVSACQRCYREEAAGATSRRHRSNQKSAIFVQAFDHSFEQSPGYEKFQSDTTTDMPIDIHVDLGNYCNLACKMCNAEASSRVAQQEIKWGNKESGKFLLDWTKDTTVWQSFLDQLLEIQGLKNIHFMGGETLLTDRFENLVDWLLAHKKTDVGLSFVTNGTVWRPDLLRKLANFARVGIEVSIETIDEHNAYQRQGTDTAVVLNNIQQYQNFANGNNITVTLRPAVSLLTIGYMPGLVRYAVDNQLIIKSLLVTAPRHLDAEILPESVKLSYLQKYQELLNELSSHRRKDYNASDPNEYLAIAAQQVDSCVKILSTPTPSDSEQQLATMVDHCRKWDQVYQYNARELYPELNDVWQRYAY